MGRWVVAIVAIFLLFGAFAASINSGIISWRTQDLTQGFAVSTGAGVTSANVTLSNDLFQDDVTRVISITSNVTGESPVATSYATATNVLLVSALNASETHTLTVNYYADTENSALQAVGPFLGFIVFGLLLFGIFHSSKGR